MMIGRESYDVIINEDGEQGIKLGTLMGLMPPIDGKRSESTYRQGLEERRIDSMLVSRNLYTTADVEVAGEGMLVLQRN
eukprot:12933216-Prorocentrum_lima.AAC.1